jgi:hypothetical protein
MPPEELEDKKIASSPTEGPAFVPDLYKEYATFDFAGFAGTTANLHDVPLYDSRTGTGGGSTPPDGSEKPPESDGQKNKDKGRDPGKESDDANPKPPKNRTPIDHTNPEPPKPIPIDETDPEPPKVQRPAVGPNGLGKAAAREVPDAQGNGGRNPKP